jgi:hypothetical protein
MMAADLKRDTALREAVILASGVTIVDGKSALKELRQLQLKRYIQALDAAAYRDRAEYMVQPMKDIIENP